MSTKLYIHHHNAITLNTHLNSNKPIMETNIETTFDEVNRICRKDLMIINTNKHQLANNNYINDSINEETKERQRGRIKKKKKYKRNIKKNQLKNKAEPKK